MVYYDTHCHIDLTNNIEEIIKEIEDEQIYVLAMTNLPVLFNSLQNNLSSKYIRVSLGFHPELVFKYKNLIPEMWKYLDKTKYIGEVGLDFSKNINQSDKEVQIEFFKELINRCNSIEKKILSIHSRGAENEIEAILNDKFNGTLIFHWYTGKITVMEKLLKNNVYFSVNKAMTQSNSGKKIIKNIPLPRMLLETDFPFIKTSENKYKKYLLDEIIYEIANLKNTSIIEIQNTLSNNFKIIIKNNS